MVRGIHGHHVLVHGELVPVLVDDLTYVVARERHGKRGERADDRVAGGERLVVAVHLGRLLVAGHGDHPQVGKSQDRAL